MEQTPRTPLRPHGLRPLALPRPIQVQLDAHGLPTRLRTNHRAALPLRALARPTTNTRRTPSRPTSARLTTPSDRPIPAGRTFDVLDVSEIWRIAEEWWRDHPIQRTYYRLVLQDGRPITIFHDETELPAEAAPSSEDTATTCAGWFEQRY
jgi:hypothetical protein